MPSEEGMVPSRPSGRQRGDPKRDKRLLLLLGGAILGAALLIFGSMGAADKETAAAEAQAPPELDPEKYAEEVEERVGALCAQVKGAGTVRAVVTLKGGYRAVYATDSQSTGNGYKNSTVLIGSGSSEGAVLICYENPEIAGIGIVCTGGDDPAVRDRIVALVAAAFDVGTNKIFVAAAKQS